jgi:hypothetical protein
MTTPDAEWTDWVVVNGYSGFRVASADGHVEMSQVGVKDFCVGTKFVFAHGSTLDKLQRVLSRTHDPDVAAQMVNKARTFEVDRELTDLASVPKFMSWFEMPYGRHTLAAMIHDRLITDGDPNTGALGSDALADAFFREMLRVAGVPVFKRWLMWAGVALRTRWAAGGYRRVLLAIWILLALLGNVMVIAAVGQGIGGWGELFGWSPLQLLAGVFVLPFAAGALWGKQFGASVVTAAGGAWLLPAAVIVLLGLSCYFAIERVLSLVCSRWNEHGTVMWDPPAGGVECV